MRSRGAGEEPVNQADQEIWRGTLPFGSIVFSQQSHLNATSAASLEQIENQTDAIRLASYNGPDVAPASASMMRLTQQPDDLVSHPHNRPIGQHSYRHPHHIQNQFTASNAEPTRGFAGLYHPHSFTSSDPRDTAATASISGYPPSVDLPFIASSYAAATQPNPFSSDLQQRAERVHGQHTAQRGRLSSRTEPIPPSLTRSRRPVASQPSGASLYRQDLPSKRRRIDDFSAFRPATEQLTLSQYQPRDERIVYAQSTGSVLSTDLYSPDYGTSIPATSKSQPDLDPPKQGLDLLADLMKDWSRHDVEEFVTASIVAFSENSQADEETLVATKGQLLLDIVASISEDDSSPSGSSSSPSDLTSSVPDELDFGTLHPQVNQPSGTTSPSTKAKIEGFKPQRKRGTASVDSNGSQLLELKDPTKYKKNGKKPRDPISLLPVGITLPKDVIITAKEICTFCPESLAIPEATMRMMRNRVKPEVLATWQVEAVGKADDEKEFGKRLGVIKHQRAVAGNTMLGRPKDASWKTREAEEQGLQGDLTADHWGQAEGTVFGHVKLRDIYGPKLLATWPTGLDRGIMTQCLEWAYQHQNQHADLTTQHWNWIIAKLGASARDPVLPPHTEGNLDTDAVKRFYQTHHRTKPLPR